MNVLPLLPVFVVGLAGGVHCVGMCGGIVGALSMPPAGMTTRPATTATAAQRAAIPISLSRTTTTTLANSMARMTAYNGGRVASYMLAGALAGGLAGGVQSLTRLATLQLALYWMANLMLVALGLTLAGAWHGLAPLERGGQLLWRRAQPVIAPAMRRLLPVDRPFKAFALGALWGWIPCAMVYSVLLTAMLSGSAGDGAAVMLAFGLGTLPMLTAMGLLGARLGPAMRRPRVRRACGLLVLAFGLLGLMRAAHGTMPAWMEAMCLTMP